MDTLGKKITIQILNSIGDYKNNNEIYSLNMGKYNDIDTYVIDKYIKLDSYTGYIIGIAYRGRKKVAYLVSSQKNKIYSREYLKSKIDFLKFNYVQNYIPNKNNNFPIRYFDLDGSYYVVNGYEYYNLFTALEDVASVGFYYSYDTLINKYLDDKTYIGVKGHSHDHEFESVLCSLFANPKCFAISSNEKQFYSDQEIHCLRAVKSFLLAASVSNMAEMSNEKRIKLSRVKEFGNYYITSVSNDIKASIINNNQAINICFSDYKGLSFPKSKALLRNDDIIFALAKTEIKTYEQKDLQCLFQDFPELSSDEYENFKNKFISQLDDGSEFDKYYIIVKKYILDEKLNQDYNYDAVV